jgi:hypothetical protein
MSNELRNFLALTYDELEELNLEAAIWKAGCTCWITTRSS